jgi:hypothetical protein
MDLNELIKNIAPSITINNYNININIELRMPTPEELEAIMASLDSLDKLTGCADEKTINRINTRKNKR